MQNDFRFSPCLSGFHGVVFLRRPSFPFKHTLSMIELLPALETAVWAIKTARDIFHKVTEHKDRCGALIDRCEELIVHICAQFPPGSPAQLDRELTNKVEEYVTASLCLYRRI